MVPESRLLALHRHELAATSPPGREALASYSDEAIKTLQDLGAQIVVIPQPSLPSEDIDEGFVAKFWSDLGGSM